MRQALLITVLWLPLSAVAVAPALFAALVLDTEPAGFFQWMVAVSMQGFPRVCLASVVAAWLFLGSLQLQSPSPENVARTWNTLMLLPAVPLVLWVCGWAAMILFG